MTAKILYINPLGEKIFFATYIDNVRQEKYIDIPFLQFAEEFPKILTKEFQKHIFDEIWIINGPGTFTKMRIISITINALKFSFPHIILKFRHFFDIIDNGYIPLLEANTKEFLTRENGEDAFINHSSLSNKKNYCGYITKPLPEGISFEEYHDNFDKIASLFDTTSPQNFISPIYIKSPHITCQKISHT